MKRLTLAAALAVLLLVLTAAYAAAQAQYGPMMMGPYDPNTEITIQGTVERINRFGMQNMRGMGMHLIVKTANEIANVHLGPTDFVEKTMTFKEGDTIQVIGSKVTMMGKTAVIAREVKKGKDVLKLRDDHGVPLWSGMHRRIS